MSGRRKRFGKCGHFGFGQHCHRCAESARLTALAEKKRPGKVRTALLAEATRLNPSARIIDDP